MPETPILLPNPRTLTVHGNPTTLAPDAVITIPDGDLSFEAQMAQVALREWAGVEWSVGNGTEVGLALTIRAGRPCAQGYGLSVRRGRITIEGADAAGVYYGVCTLRQLLMHYGSALPDLDITDWPDFPARGVLLDISRDRVPTMDTLYNLIDLLASWKINQFQLYTEHTFAYRDHREVWEHASPITADEARALDAYCRQRHVDLVPNQNSFGHMHRWFEHPRYLPLAESDGRTRSPWGTWFEHPFSLSPAVPGVLDFLNGLYAELLPNFSSRMFNVGCDETFDLGADRTKALVEQKGKGRVYLDFLLDIYRLVTAHGRTMQFWGDIINQYPDLVPELPKDAIALEWGYEADHDFPGKTKLFAESGVPFYVCPGTSSWTTIAGRTDNCMGNIRSAVENGLKHGAIGVLNTDWGDWGHWQPLPVSTLGFAYGAGVSWAYEQNTALDLPAVLDRFVFHDEAGIMGRLAYDLGNAYQQPGILIPNGSLLFWAYHNPLASFQKRREAAGLSEDSRLSERLEATLAYIDRVIEPLDAARMARPDAALVRREFALAAHMLQHGARRLLFQLGRGELDAGTLRDDLDAIETEYRAVWLARSRPGGLDDSAARLVKARELYTKE